VCEYNLWACGVHRRNLIICRDIWWHTLHTHATHMHIHTQYHTHTHTYTNAHTHTRDTLGSLIVWGSVCMCVCAYIVCIWERTYTNAHTHTRVTKALTMVSLLTRWRSGKGKPLPAGCNLSTSRRGCRERLWRLLDSEPHGGAGRSAPYRGLHKTNTGWRGYIGCLICTGDFLQRAQ